MRLKFKKIRLDGGTQPREEINEYVVGDYRDDMRNGDVFPPITVFYDGADYWLADGFHRYRAAIDLYQGHEAKDDAIEVDVRQGSRRDAILFAVGANATHGERRTHTDKRRAVETLLKDKEWGKWSDREIARRCAVSHTFVENLRKEVTGNVASEKSGRTFTTKHGTQAVMNTANIGKAASRTLSPVSSTRIKETGSDVIEAEAVVDSAIEQETRDPVEESKAELAEIEGELAEIKARLEAWREKTARVLHLKSDVGTPGGMVLNEERHRVRGLVLKIWGLL